MIFNLLLCVSILLIYFVTHLGGRDKKVKDKMFLLITFILLFILVASREFTIGNDTPSYLDIYNRCNIYKWGVFSKTGYYEPGYLALNVILNYLHVSPRLFLTILALIFNYAIYKFIKDNSSNYLMSVLLYINLLYFYQSMNILRQFFALSIILLFGYKLIKEKKLKKYIITVLFAALFHSTALFAIFLYPLCHLRHSRKMIALIIIGAIVGTLLLNQVYPIIASLLNREEFYINMMGEAKLGNIIKTLIFLSMYLFSLIIIKRNERQNYNSYLNILLFTTAIFFTSINMAVLSRAGQYFSIISLISLPNMIESNIKESKVLVRSSIVTLFMIYSSIIIVNKPEWNSAYNYKSCLLPESTYICE